VWTHRHTLHQQCMTGDRAKQRMQKFSLAQYHSHSLATSNRQRAPRHPLPSTPLSHSFTSTILRLSSRVFWYSSTAAEACLTCPDCGRSKLTTSHSLGLQRTPLSFSCVPPLDLQGILLLAYFSLYGMILGNLRKK